ncbi:MAG TPA: hypothetical protein VF911_00950 [Thermoanaerobaculia bacterium]|jgi:hypothetical protein
MNLVHRAAQIWPLLTLAASLRLTLTYKRVGELIGAPPVALGDWMEPIQSYCLVHRLPPLTVLVVGESDGMPGTGFVGAVDVPRAQAAVFRHDWVRTPVPKPEELALAVAQRPSNGIRSAAESTTEP